jgi:hypothetical protein
VIERAALAQVAAAIRTNAHARNARSTFAELSPVLLTADRSPLLPT